MLERHEPAKPPLPAPGKFTGSERCLIHRMAGPGTFVIVGANLAGGAAVSTLREDGFDGRIVLIGEEPDPPFERPPLSKDYLRGETAFDRTLLRPPAWYEEAGVDLRLGVRATSVDPSARSVELEGGERVTYDRLLVTTGGANRPLAVTGVGLDGILELRTRADADRIRAEARPGRTAVVVGAGFIGMEVAASLRQMGMAVEVVEILSVPLLRVLGPEVGAVFEAVHRDHGVRFHFRDDVRAFRGRDRVEEVVTVGGARIGCDFVVVGIGITPSTGVVAGSGIDVDDGIVVDEFCRTTVDGVYAAGDVANQRHPLFGRRIRVEHWDNALKQGAAAARNMMGREEPFDDTHWFWSDQYQDNLQYAGFASEWDRLVVRGRLEERSFLGFYLKDGLVDAVVGMNRGNEVRRSARLIRRRQPVDPAALRDEDVDLKKLSA
jgi:3-phenylpropionate/trans-cinnamate dioxygenase ferredoxin reductase subunit